MSARHRLSYGIPVMLLIGAIWSGQTGASDDATNAVPSVTAPKADTVPAGRDGARHAQRLYRRGKYREAADAYLEAARGGSRSTQQDARYNAAVSLFKAGEYRRAADVFREIEQAEDAETEASRGLGAALFEAAQDAKEETAEALAERAGLLRHAGEAFKEAFRSDDEISEHNLAVVLRQLPEAEEQAKIARLLEEYGDMPPFALAEKMRSEQKSIIEEAPGAFTNATPARIAELETMAARQEAVSDLWIPLKGKLQSSLAEQQGQGGATSAGDLDRFVEHIRDLMHESAASFRDLEPRAYDTAVVAEDGIYQVWKGLAPYAQVLEEDLRRQTNTIDASQSELDRPGTAMTFARANQSEGIGLTELFVQRFTQAVPETPPQDQPPSTQAPGEAPQKPQISEEDRAKILDLADEAGATQRQALDLLDADKPEQSLPLQHRSYDLLKEIQALLPKDDSQSNDQQQQQQSPQQPQDPPPPEDNQDQPPEEPPDEDQPPQTPDEQPAQPQSQPESMADEELEELMQKALQREQEYKDAKERLERTVPLAPHARDW